MTKVRIEKEKHTISLTCNGHSGYGESGTDIVCASISVMVCAFMALCDELEEKDDIVVIRKEEGDAHVLLRVFDPYDNTKSALQMMVLALKDIADQYPQNLSVEWEEINF